MAEDSSKPVIDYEKLKARPQTRNRAVDFRAIYVSSTNVEVSFLDFKFFFGEIMEATPEKLVVEDHVAVIMTPEQAKSIFRLLETQISNYESLYGSIRNPPGE